MQHACLAVGRRIDDDVAVAIRLNEIADFGGCRPCDAAVGRFGETALTGGADAHDESAVGCFHQLGFIAVACGRNSGRCVQHLPCLAAVVGSAYIFIHVYQCPLRAQAGVCHKHDASGFGLKHLAGCAECSVPVALVELV